MLARLARIAGAIFVIVLIAALVIFGIQVNRAQTEAQNLRAYSEQLLKERDQAQTQARTVASVRDQALRDLAQCQQQRDSLLLQTGLMKNAAAAPNPAPVATTTTAIAINSEPSTSSTPTTSVVIYPTPSSSVTVKVIGTPEPTTGGTYATSKIEQTADGYTQLSVINPEAGPQFTQRYSVVYSPTEVGKTVRYRIDVPKGYVAIVGGFRVDTASGGIYQALRPGKYTRTVVDGFTLIIRDEWAQEEWTTRLNQARDNKWAMAVIDAGPLK